MTHVFVSPHDDDQVLFGAFTLLRVKPIVIIVYDSYAQPARGLRDCDARTRAFESREANRILGCPMTVRLQISDAENNEGSVDHLLRLAIESIDLQSTGDIALYYPATEHDGHEQHNIVSRTCESIVEPIATRQRYLTYTRGNGKSEWGREVAIEDPMWIPRKLSALACFRSQFNLDPRMGCWPHFLRNQMEYYA